MEANRAASDIASQLNPPQYDPTRHISIYLGIDATVEAKRAASDIASQLNLSFIYLFIYLSIYLSIFLSRYRCHGGG